MLLDVCNDLVCLGLKVGTKSHQKVIGNILQSCKNFSSEKQMTQYSIYCYINLFDISSLFQITVDKIISCNEQAKMV